VKSAPLDARGIQHRRQILKILEQAQRGHVGSAFSVMEIVRVLYDDILRFDPKNPRWLDRDRFIFSKGHGCLAFYVMLAEKGFFPEEDILSLEKFPALKRAPARWDMGFRSASVARWRGGLTERTTAPSCSSATASPTKAVCGRQP
jgi:transketolase N-terminal domain/subunit